MVLVLGLLTPLLQQRQLLVLRLLVLLLGKAMRPVPLQRWRKRSLSRESGPL